MKHEIVFICIALLIVPTAQAAYIINPGQSHNCTAEGELVSCGLCTGNETCEECQECEESGVCSIDKEILPGELYEKQEGVCDVEVYCETCDSKEIQEKDYTTDVHIDKETGTDVYLTIETRDWMDTIVQSLQEEFANTSVIANTYRYEFTCPTEVVLEGVNYKTCSQYFDEYFTEEQPIMFQLATGQTDCIQSLMGCQGNISANRDLMNHYKDLYTDCDSQKDVMKKNVTSMSDRMKTMERDITGRVTAESQGTIASWFWAAIVGWVLFVGLLLTHFVGGDL